MTVCGLCGQIIREQAFMDIRWWAAEKTGPLCPGVEGYQEEGVRTDHVPMDAIPIEVMITDLQRIAEEL